VPFRVELIEAVARPNLPAGKGILALRHAHPDTQTQLIGESGLKAEEAKALAAWLRVHGIPFTHVGNEPGD
jgi:hypothetical protein